MMVFLPSHPILYWYHLAAHQDSQTGNGLPVVIEHAHIERIYVTKQIARYDLTPPLIVLVPNSVLRELPYHLTYHLNSLK